MKEQLDCATVFCLAAQAQKAQGNLAQAIHLYKKAGEAYARCDQDVTGLIGLVYIEIATCLSDLGEEATSELYFSKVVEIMRARSRATVFEYSQASVIDVPLV